ncbi:MAG TPA: aldehyde dehydrogenase family protein, partial [Thermoleophilaceae bacterium]
MAVATNEQQVLESIPTKLYIGGDWVDGADGDTIAVEDPSTEETLIEVASGGKDDALKALDAASSTQKEWAATSPMERGEILRRAYELMTERADDLALLMTLEMGKPVEESKAEITYAADFFWYYAGEASRIEGHYGTSYNGRGRVLVMQQPVGPSILITPWNFPMAMGTRKIGPALAAGCTMVWKPAKQTPLCALALT